MGFSCLAIYLEISVYPEKFLIYSYILGKLDHFSSKLTTFKHTSCTQ